jgi:hypothetical protein
MQPSTTSLKLDLSNCIHCPPPLDTCLQSSAIGLILVAVAAMCWKSERRALQMLFWPITVLATLWYLLMTFGVFRFGIWWPTRVVDENQELSFPGVLIAAADRIYLVAWYAVSLLVIAGVDFLKRRRARS